MGSGGRRARRKIRKILSSGYLELCPGSLGALFYRAWIMRGGLELPFMLVLEVLEKGGVWKEKD